MAQHAPETQPSEHHYDLQADAFCMQCNTVNPDGTLICKTCGNNLRDQHQMRMATDIQLEGGEATPGSFQVRRLTGALGVLGLLIVVWTAINADSVIETLMGLNTTRYDPVMALWNGEEAPAFDAMLDTLRSQAVTGADFEAALAAPVLVDVAPEGTYIITRPAVFGEATRAGTALVEADENGGLRFAALLRDGTEVRGRAMRRGQAHSAEWDMAGVRYQGQYYSATGIAIPLQNGGVECFGDSELTDAGISFDAYRLP